MGVFERIPCNKLSSSQISRFLVCSPKDKTKKCNLSVSNIQIEISKEIITPHYSQSDDRQVD